MKTAGLALLVAMTISLPAAAQAEEKKNKKTDQVVCKISEVTGSRLNTTRVCKTRAQWSAYEAGVQKEHLDLLQSSPRAGNPDDRPK